MLHSHLTCKNVHNSKLNRNDIRMIFFCKAFVVKDSKFQKSDTTRGATTQLAHSLIRNVVFGSQFWFGSASDQLLVVPVIRTNISRVATPAEKSF